MADSRIPELVADLEAQAVAFLVRQQIKHDVAVLLSKQLSRHLTDNWGGQLIYFPKNHGGALDARDKQIWAEFNGKNHQQLAKKYDLAVQQVYKIVKQAGEAEMMKRQLSLLD